MPTLKAEQLRAISEELFVQAGANVDNARCLAEHMVLANLTALAQVLRLTRANPVDVLRAE